MATIKGYKYRDQGLTYTNAQLVAAGDTDVVDMSGCNGIVFQYVVAAKNTSVTVRASGSHDNSSWFNLDFDNTDTTHTANGTYAMQYDGRVAYTKFTFVSEAGGTDVTVDVQMYIGMAV